MAHNRIRELEAELTKSQMTAESDRRSFLDIDPAMLLNFVRKKLPKSKITLPDIKAILEVLQEES